MASERTPRPNSEQGIEVAAGAVEVRVAATERKCRDSMMAR